MRSLRLSVPLLLATLSLLCPNGARSQVARNVTLISHLKQYSSYSNSWSYIHPDGREYVALGTRFGLSIVRLTDPANPVEVGFFPSINCTTRDADQYQTYIYAIGAVCGNASPGLTIISMADPDHPVLVSELHGVLESSENITVDQARGLLWAAEVNELQAAGGIRILSLADPLNPTLVYANDAYGVHDVTVKGTRAYLNDLSNETIHLLDATNPSSPIEITSFPTGGSAHSAWPTEDDRYLVTTNEEPNGVLVFDIQNPLQPVQTWHEALDPDAPAHYPRVLGSRAFIAHYLAGVRILDLSNPAWPVESGYLDTYLGDNEIFAGVYDTCPFYPSGIATATDMADGLYVYRVDPPNYGLVRGTVMDGRSPLEGATVRIPPNGPSTLTGPDGRYGLAPDAGSVTIELSKFGYTTQTAVRAVSIGSDQTVNFAAQKAATGNLKGTVVESITQSGLGAAEVTCADTPLLATTTARGTYSLSKTPVGSYTVRADRPGYVPAEVTASIVAKKTTQVNFSLAPAPFYDDADVDRGWTLGAPGDNATAGQWIRAVPIASTSSTGFELQPGADHTPDPGTMCFVTGNGPVGGGQNLADVDGGKTTLISPVLPLAAVPDPRIVFWRFYYSNNAGPNASPLVTEISNDGGASWVVCDSIHAATRAWKRFEVRVTDFFLTPADVRVRVIAQDRSTSAGSTVEALIDDFEYYSGTGLSSGTAGPPTAIQPPTSPLLVRVRDRSRDGETLELSAAGGLSRATVRIFDIRGRLVRTLHEGALVGGTTRLVWNRRSDHGERVANGVYIVQASAGQARAETKIVLIR